MDDTATFKLEAMPETEKEGCDSRPSSCSPSVKTEVWSCGGGTQSVAVAALIILGKLPKPEVCIIADTGRETQSTWDYLHGVLNPALKEVGLTIEIADAAKLCYNGIKPFWRTGQLLVPAFSNIDGGEGKLSAFCSAKWKKARKRWRLERCSRNSPRPCGGG